MVLSRIEICPNVLFRVSPVRLFPVMEAVIKPLVFLTAKPVKVPNCLGVPFKPLCRYRLKRCIYINIRGSMAILSPTNSSHYDLSESGEISLLGSVSWVLSRQYDPSTADRGHYPWAWPWMVPTNEPYLNSIIAYTDIVSHIPA